MAFAARALLVALVSALQCAGQDSQLQGGGGQAAEAIPSRLLARIAIFAGLCVEVVMSLAVLTGVADRMAATILAGYCVVTALLWKQFWKAPDFRLRGTSGGRDIFWDFRKISRWPAAFWLWRSVPARPAGRASWRIRWPRLIPTLRAREEDVDGRTADGTYWHLWTDADGISRQKRCAMTEFDLKSIKPPADPQWQGSRTSGSMTVMVTVLPAGWIGTWHENRKPQWIVPLSGRWFVEAMDGTRVEMGAGEISFGGDQHCRDLDGKRGHRSGTSGMRRRC